MQERTRTRSTRMRARVVREKKTDLKGKMGEVEGLDFTGVKVEVFPEDAAPPSSPPSTTAGVSEDVAEEASAANGSKE